jgi:tetratricopeptide (TPR) repeat protein
LLIVGLVGAIWLPVGAGALTLTDRLHSNVSKGNKHYRADEHQQALERYVRAQRADSSHAVPVFNAGDALYRLGEFPESAQRFLRSASLAEDSISAMGYYNLGNSLFRAGDTQRAIEAYRKSLLIDPTDGDAKYNLELAMKLLEEQQQQQDQQDEKDQGDQDQEEPAKERERDQQDEQQDQDEKQPQQQDQPQQQQEPRPEDMSPEELERILAAIEASDREAQQEMLEKQSRHRRISGKDW